MDYSALIGIHDVEMASSPLNPATAAGAMPGVGEAEDGPSSSVSPNDAAGLPSHVGDSRGVGGSASGHQEPQASAGDGLGEIFEERLFGHPCGTQAAPAAGVPSVAHGGTPVGSYSSVGCVGGNLSDLSPPNSDEYEAAVTGSGVIPTSGKYSYCLFRSVAVK